jgi:hypothetical protein
MGDWELGETRAEYQGSDTSSRGILLGHSRLCSGEVKTTVELSEDVDSGRILLGFESLNSRYLTAGLGGFGEAYVIAEFDPGIGWTRLDGVGSRSNLQAERPYDVEVKLGSQRLALFVDGIRVLSYVLAQPLAIGQVGVFAWGIGTVGFGSVEVSADPPSAFVVMQFSSPYDELYDEVIEPTCKNLGIKAYRARDIYRPSVILQDIIQGLAESNVIIAEITPTNANVFYELGYAHALRKPVILLAEQGRQLPFDIGGYRVIFYEDAIRGKSGLETELRRHLANIFNE